MACNTTGVELVFTFFIKKKYIVLEMVFTFKEKIKHHFKCRVCKTVDVVSKGMKNFTVVESVAVYPLWKQFSLKEVRGTPCTLKKLEMSRLCSDSKTMT